MATAAKARFTVWDIRSVDTTVCHTDILPVFEISHEMSKPVAVSYTITFADRVIDMSYTPPVGVVTTAKHLVNASGGADGQQDVLPYLCGISLDGGDAYDVYFMLSEPVHNATFSDTTQSIFHGYEVTGVDRVTFHGVKLGDALKAKAGTIQANGIAGPDSFLSSVYLPYQKGLFQTVPGLGTWLDKARLQYTVFIDQHIIDVRVNSDTEADYISQALNVYVNQTAGVVSEGDTAPIGSRAQWVEDSSDPALNQQYGTSPTLVVGNLGLSPYVHFRVMTAADTITANTAPILENAESHNYMDIKSNVKDVLAKVSYVGGQTNHGLPDGGSILSPITIYPTTDVKSSNWTDNLCLFVSADSSGFGGVYYWPHDGQAYPVGGSLLNPKVMVYKPSTNELFVSTDLGVYTRTADVRSNDDWTRVGGLLYKCGKLIYDKDFGKLLVEVKGNGTADGIYMYPGIAGDTSGSIIGFNGWSFITSGSFVDWSYSGPGEELVFADSNSSSMVTRMIYSGTAGGSSTTWVPTPNNSPVKSLNPMRFTFASVDPISGTEKLNTETGTAVCTMEGSLGLYYLDPRGNFHKLNEDGSLTDPYGYPVGVNSLFSFEGSVIVGNRTIKPKLFALTDSGLYFSESQYGNGWQGLQAQSGILDQSITGLAVGQPQSLVGRPTSRLYATNGKSLYCSHTGGVFWDDEIAEPVTIGAYLGELYATRFGSTADRPIPHIHLDNNTTSLGTIPANGSTGTSGSNIPGPFPAPYNLKGDLVWVRPLDEHNKWTYRLVHSTSQVPYTPIEFGEVVEILTDSSSTNAIASGRLAQAMVRYLGDRSRLQLTLTIRSSFSDSGHNLRKLRPNMMVDVTYNPGGPWNTSFNGTQFYVTKHKIYKPEGYTVPYTETVVSTTPRTSNPTMSEIANGIIYTNSKIIRKAGRVKR